MPFKGQAPEQIPRRCTGAAAGATPGCFFMALSDPMIDLA
jgi:hypothetical protein